MVGSHNQRILHRLMLRHVINTTTATATTLPSVGVLHHLHALALQHQLRVWLGARRNLYRRRPIKRANLTGHKRIHIITSLVN